MQALVRSGSSAEETRSRILAAARAIYEEKGTRGTTTREVAERAGVNEATLFRHFGNKQALLIAMRQGACPIEFLEELLGGLTGDLPQDLRSVMRSLVERIHDRRAMLCISMAEEARNTEESVDFEWQSPSQVIQRLDTYFALQIAAGKMRGESNRLAKVFMGLCLSYVIGRKIWDSYTVKTDDVDYMVDVFLNGVT